MDPRIQAALIAAFSALIGVVIGGFIQSYLKDRELKHKKRIAEGAATLYLCRLRLLFEGFSNERSALDNLSLGISPNDNNISEIEMVTDIIKIHDPFLLVRLFDIKQRLHNIRSYCESFHENLKGNRPYNNQEIIVKWMVTDAKGGLKDSDECIKHSFNRSEGRTKKYLLENNDFKTFLPKIIEDTWFQRFKLKFNMVSKI